MPIWWGLVFSGVYVLATPQIIMTIPDWVENVLGFELSLFAVLCLTGSRMRNGILAYEIERVGLLGIVMVLGILAVATEATVWQQFTLTGGLGGLVQIGSIRMIVNLTRALER